MNKPCALSRSLKRGNSLVARNCLTGSLATMVPGEGGTGLGLRCHALQSHQPHQPLHLLAVDLVSFHFERLGQHSTAKEGVFQMKFVDLAHQRQVLGVRLDRGVVQV